MSAALRAVRLGLPALATMLVMLLSACAPADAPVAHRSLPQEIYVWQRAWTPEVARAVDALDKEVHGVRLLWAQFRHDDVRFAMRIRDHHAVLVGRSVRPVLRLEGSRPTTPSATVASAAKQAIAHLTALGAEVTAIEIDLDVATDQLEVYASWLGRLRAELPQGLRLSITALPDWARSPSLPALLREADEVVVQVHAPGSLDVPLFEPVAAEAALREFRRGAGRTAVWVALPAYRVGVGMDDAGGTPLLEFEPNRGESRVWREERVADPQQLLGFVQRIHAGELPEIRGILWFRLPLASDRHALSPATFAALLQGGPLHGELRTESCAVPGAVGSHDLFVHNVGEHDAVFAQPAAWPEGCVAGDAAAAWRVNAGAFVARSPGGILVRAGERQRIGWVRCPGVVQAAK